ncbi:hypothetical protein WKW50_24550 [Ochrobactrum sp. GPK 3]|uniref:hypothetical protein n=1 Tax=Brucella sp. 22210 TaxID=3453892 RepID=UPI0031384B26
MKNFLYVSSLILASIVAGNSAYADNFGPGTTPGSDATLVIYCPGRAPVVIQAGKDDIPSIKIDPVKICAQSE